MGRHMNTVEQTEIWDRYEAGQTLREIAASVGGFAGEYGGLVGFYLFPGDRNPLCLVPEPAGVFEERSPDVFSGGVEVAGVDDNGGPSVLVDFVGDLAVEGFWFVAGEGHDPRGP